MTALAILGAWASITTACHAIDGDTIVCGREHIRLTAIDAPEMPGHCRRGRDCAPGDPFASRAALQRKLDQGDITIVRLGLDRYGRTVADVRVRREAMSCAQVAAAYARYWPRYDRGGRIKRECGL